MIKHAMFDCETLGVGNNPVLLSIACVIFTDDGSIIDKFHQHVNVSEFQYGATFSGSTVLWWMDQSKEARNAIIEGQKEAASYYSAVVGLHDFLELHKPTSVWSYGARADLTWLDSAYDSIFDRNEGWTYKQERCLRTIGGIFDPKGELRPKPTVKHDALADAESQVEWLLRMGARHDFPIQ